MCVILVKLSFKICESYLAIVSSFIRICKIFLECLVLGRLIVLVSTYFQHIDLPAQRGSLSLLIPSQAIASTTSMTANLDLHNVAYVNICIYSVQVYMHFYSMMITYHWGPT